ncbi:MAG: putative selenium-dependent hydroxylase accessory protein YqeC [Acidobacteria bacterium]|nr:MAG: putative selenium-dependent hydroxylase accessory protein YqeC [Acidobacteriota bacterium]
MNNQRPFLKTFKITETKSSPIVVSIVGMGGKTSMLFQLAEEAKALGKRVLITTTTKMWVPKIQQYDFIDLSGQLFSHISSEDMHAGIYVGAIISAQQRNKIRGVESKILQPSLNKFDLVVIEADGSRSKPLKGWRKDEPVVPDFSHFTIGILDITCLEKVIDQNLVLRLELFCKLTNSQPGDQVTLDHLAAIISNQRGLFQNAAGKKIVFLNKAESQAATKQCRTLAAMLPAYDIYYGSILNKQVTQQS